MSRDSNSQRSDRLTVTFAHPGDPHESLTARRAYASVPGLRFRRMVMTRHDDSQRGGRLAVTQRGGSRLTRIWAGLYTRPRMGTDSIQPSRLPTTASRAAADLAAPVLTAAPLMRVAHSRHASARPTADPVGRKLRSTAAGTSVPDQSSRRQMRAICGTGWSDGRATVLSGQPIAQKGGCKMILKEPHARAA